MPPGTLLSTSTAPMKPPPTACSSRAAAPRSPERRSSPPPRQRFVCIIDDTKLVAVLGGFPLPVEVIAMARSYVARQLVKIGGQPVWREGVVTDNGNPILDVHNLKLADPKTLESAMNQIAGVVTVGLFARRRADVLIVAGDAGVRTLDLSEHSDGLLNL